MVDHCALLYDDVVNRSIVDFGVTVFEKISVIVHEASKKQRDNG